MKRLRQDQVQQQQVDNDENLKQEEEVKGLFKCHGLERLKTLKISTPVNKCSRTTKGDWVVSQNQSSWQVCTIKPLEHYMFRYQTVPIVKTFLLSTRGYDDNDGSMLNIYTQQKLTGLQTSSSRLSRRRQRDTLSTVFNTTVYTGIFCPIFINVGPQDTKKDLQRKMKNEIDFLLDTLQTNPIREGLPDKDLINEEDIDVFFSCLRQMVPFQTPSTTIGQLVRTCGDQTSRKWDQRYQKEYEGDQMSWVSVPQDPSIDARVRQMYQDIRGYTKKELLQDIQREMSQDDMKRVLGYSFREMSRLSNEGLVPLITKYVEWFVKTHAPQDRPPSTHRYSLYVVLPEYFYIPKHVYYTVPTQGQQQYTAPKITVPYETHFMVSFRRRVEPFDPIFLYTVMYPGEIYSERRNKTLMTEPSLYTNALKTVASMFSQSLKLHDKFELSGDGLIMKPYQAFVANYIINNPGLLCYHDAGTGKTLTAISAIVAYLSLSLKNLVFVVCPASLIKQWKAEVQRFIVPSPSVVTNAKEIETIVSFQQRVHVVSYEKLYMVIQKNMCGRGELEKDDGDYELYTHLDHHKGDILFVFDEVHEISTQFVQKQKTPPAWFKKCVGEKYSGPLKVPTGAYWVRAACTLYSKRVIYLSATPFINHLRDLQLLFYNILIAREPLSQRKIETFLLWSRVCDVKQNLEVRDQDFYSPQLPNEFIPPGCETYITTKLNSLFTGDEKDFRANMENILSFFANYRGMIHRIVRGDTSDFPPVKVFDHRIRVNPSTDYMTKYKEYIAQGLVEPKMKSRIFQNTYRLDTNLFKNQRLMATRVYEKPVSQRPLVKKNKYVHTVDGREVEYQVRSSAHKMANLRKKNLSTRVGDPQDIIRGGIFSPKLDFLMGKTHDGTGNMPPHLAGPDKKVVIYGFFHDTVDLIDEYMKREEFGYSVSVRPLVLKITGSTPLHKRDIIVQRFNETRGNIILVISTAAATGLDLKGVSDIVFFEQVWTHSLYTQITGRGVRYRSHVGIVNPLVRVHNLILTSDDGVIEFVDDFMYAIVKRKRVMSQRFDTVLRYLCNSDFPYGTFGLLTSSPHDAMTRVSQNGQSTQGTQQVQTRQYSYT